MAGNWETCPTSSDFKSQPGPGPRYITSKDIYKFLFPKQKKGGGDVDFWKLFLDLTFYDYIMWF